MWTPPAMPCIEIRTFLACGVVAAYYALQWWVVSHPLADPGMRDLAIRALGNADAASMLVLSYYFGASKESK